jgi:hypothetical protein
MRALVAALALLPLVAACSDDITAPAELPADLVGAYQLVSIDGGELPANVGFVLGVQRRTEVVDGAIELTADARFTDVTRFRVHHPDGIAYDEFNFANQGYVFLRDGGMEFRPVGLPAHRMTLLRSGDVTLLVQQWNGYELRYAQVGARAPL